MFAIFLFGVRLDQLSFLSAQFLFRFLAAYGCAWKALCAATGHHTPPGLLIFACTRCSYARAPFLTSQIATSTIFTAGRKTGASQLCRTLRTKKQPFARPPAKPPQKLVPLKVESHFGASTHSDKKLLLVAFSLSLLKATRKERA